MVVISFGEYFDCDCLSIQILIDNTKLEVLGVGVVNDNLRIAKFDIISVKIHIDTMRVVVLLIQVNLSRSTN